MSDTVIAICIEGGLVQCVATNNPRLKAKVVIVDRDCDGADPKEPAYTKYFMGDEASIYSESIMLDKEYCEEARKFTEERET